MSIVNDLLGTIESALMNDPRTHNAVIEVDNRNGIVTLSGVVDSPQTSAAAEEVVSQQSGVVKVVNQLRISDTAR
jgi:osmotically-inducible protein OsmY